MSKLEIEVKSLGLDGVSSKVQTLKGEGQIINGQFWVHVNGKNFVYEPESLAKKRKKTEKKSSSDKILSPMPGKVTKIFASPGKSFKTGEAVLVMEAMKMEYTLKSEIDAEVEIINCQVGDQVQLGQLLVQFKVKV